MGKKETKNTTWDRRFIPRQSLLTQAKQIIEAPTMETVGYRLVSMGWTFAFCSWQLLLQWPLAVGACPCWQVTDIHY